MPIPQSTRIIKTDFLRTGFGEEDITEQEYTEAEITYNEEGNILTEKHFNSDGNLESAVENKYDEQGRPISSAQYDESGELCQQNVFTYSEEGKLLKKSCFYGEGSPEYATVYVYEEGLLVREDSYNEDEFDFTEKSYEYDENGHVAVTVEYDEEGKIMTEQEDENLDTYRRTTYQYEGDKCVKVTQFDKDEAKIGWTEYEYDEQGNVTLLKNYIRDEVRPDFHRSASWIKYETEWR